MKKKLTELNPWLSEMLRGLYRGNINPLKMLRQWRPGVWQYTEYRQDGTLSIDGPPTWSTLANGWEIVVDGLTRKTDEDPDGLRTYLVRYKEVPAAEADIPVEHAEPVAFTPAVQMHKPNPDRWALDHVQGAILETMPDGSVWRVCQGNLAAMHAIMDLLDRPACTIYRAQVYPEEMWTYEQAFCTPILLSFRIDKDWSVLKAQWSKVFNQTPDNKITFKVTPTEGPAPGLYVTFHDGNVHVGLAVRPYSGVELPKPLRPA